MIVPRATSADGRSNARERVDEMAPARLGQRTEQHLIDFSSTRPQSRDHRLAFVRQAQDIGAGVMPGTTPGQQAFAHQSAHRIGGRRPIYPGRVDKTDLIGPFTLPDDHENRKLTWRKAGVGESRRKRLVRRLLRTMQQMQYTPIEIEYRYLILIHVFTPRCLLEVLRTVPHDRKRAIRPMLTSQASR